MRLLAGFAIIAVIAAACLGVGHLAVPFMAGHPVPLALEGALGLLILMTTAVTIFALFLMADSLGELVVPRKKRKPEVYYIPPISPYEGPFKE